MKSVDPPGATPSSQTQVGIIVLGMHRSGTSAFARVLSLLGAALPEHIMGPAPSNQSGHWEPERLVELHDRMLAEAGSQWDDWREFNLDLLELSRVDFYKNEIQRVILEDYGEAPLFVLKDPRICRFVPMYREVFAELGIGEKYVLPYRNPLAVAASLARRDGMSDAYAHLVWLRHILDAEEETRGHPRAFVSYEGLLDEWRPVVDHLTTGLETTWPRSIEEGGADIEASLKRSQQHHAPSIAELETSTEIDEWVKTAYAAYERLGKTGDEEAAITELDRIREELDRVTPLFGEAMFSELAVREEKQSAAIHAHFATAIEGRDEEIRRLGKRLEDTETHASNLAQHNANLDQLVDELRGRLDDASSRLSATQDSLEEVRAELGDARAEIDRNEGEISAHRKQIGEQQRVIEAQESLITTQDELLVPPAVRLGRRLRTLYFGLVERLGGPCFMRPVCEVDVAQPGGSATIWSIGGANARFELVGRNTRSLPPGDYVFGVDIPDGHERLRRPKLVVDTGSGFDHGEVIDFGFTSAGATHYVARIALPSGANAIRFAPSLVSCEVSFGRAKFRRMGAAAVETGGTPPYYRLISSTLASIMHKGGEMWHRFSAYLGRNVDLRPLHHLVRSGVDKTATAWRITGHDPYFALDGPRPRRLSPGRYILVAKVVKGYDRLTAPQLFVDYDGRGFTEEGSIDLHFSARTRGRYTAHVLLPREARRLRFDPASTPSEISLGWVRIRKLTRPQYYASRFRANVKRLRSHGDSLFSAVADSVELLWSGGVRQLAAALRPSDHQISDYQEWAEEHLTFSKSRLRRLRKELATLNDPPLLSIVMPVYNTPESMLRDAIESVRSQAYENWELCIADDGSSKPHVGEVLSEYFRLDPRIKVVRRRDNGHICHASNSALDLVTGDWVAFLDHDDLLTPNALAEVVSEIDRHPDAQVIYSDEDKMDADGVLYDPYFKPDYSRELLRSQNYFNHLTVHRAENIRAVGGWRPGFEGSQDYDLNLRIVERVNPSDIRHIPKVLYHWRAAEGSTALSGKEKDYAYEAGLRALEEHVERIGLDAKVEKAPGTPHYRMRFSIPEPAPLVSLVVPTRDKHQLLRGCVDSIIERTTYQNYEIVVVDNGSIEDETLSYFKELDSLPKVRVIHYDEQFNFSAINNIAVEEAEGSLIGLVNNDIEVISPDWLSEMVSWAVQDDIGCVGAKLYYANDTIQHAGVIVGLGGVAGHSHKYFPRDHPGYFFRLKVLQNLSAVTGACLLVRRSVYEEVGGLNAEDLAVAFNDVDFCLRVDDAGYQNVWSPYAELYHLESVSRGGEDDPVKIARFKSEIAYMTDTWGERLLNDPYYSPNLTRIREDFTPAFQR